MSWAAVAGAAVSVIGGAVSARQNRPKAENMPALTWEQQQALTNILDRLQRGGQHPYGGPVAAGPDSNQLTSLTALEQRALGNVDQDREDRTRILDAISKAGDLGLAEKTFTDSVEAPARKSFQENTLPQIGRRFRGNSIFGTDMQNTEIKAASDLEGHLTGSRSKYIYDTAGRGADAAIRGQSALQGIDDQRLKAILALFGAGSTMQGQAQTGMDRQYGRFRDTVSDDNTNIAQILQALGLGTNNTVVTPGSTGFLTNAAQGMGQAFTQAALRRWLEGGGTSTGGSTSPTTSSNLGEF